MTGFGTLPPPPSVELPAPPVVEKARVPVTVGATLMVVGGALMIAGSVLNWFDLDKEAFNGFTTGLENVTNVKGRLFDILGVIVLGFGITQLLAKRVLAIGIIGAVISSVGLIVGLKALSDVNDLVDFGRVFGADVATGPGLYVAAAGGVIATLGSIATVAKQSG